MNMIGAVFRWPESSVAVIDEDGGGRCSYGDLQALVGECQQALNDIPRPALVFQLCRNGLGGIAAYLGALAGRVPLLLADPDAPATESLLKAYLPTAVLVDSGRKIPVGYSTVKTVAGGRVRLCVNEAGLAYPVTPHPDLALLLTTSGSTGNPKIVRLTQENLWSNATSIATYLGIGPGEISIQSLPMHYSYGLSLVNSHLAAGGAVAMTNRSCIRTEFWSFFDEAKCTSMAGVPYMYETMLRLAIQPSARPTLRTMTQARGHLRPEIVKRFHEQAHSVGKRFFVMYGATEATARIAYVPPNRLAEKLGYIGIAIPDGTLSLQKIEDAAYSELVYDGPNVMMGYAECPAHLVLGDIQKGRLCTGDLAETSADGYFRITGRLARFAKLFGKRIYLGDIETFLEARLGVAVAATEGSDCLDVFHEGGQREALEKGCTALAVMLGVPQSIIRPHALAEIPKTSSGKKDYKTLKG